MFSIKREEARNLSQLFPAAGMQRKTLKMYQLFNYTLLKFNINCQLSGFERSPEFPTVPLHMESTAAVRWRRQRRTPDPKPPEFLEEKNTGKVVSSLPQEKRVGRVFQKFLAPKDLRWICTT